MPRNPAGDGVAPVERRIVHEPHFGVVGVELEGCVKIAAVDEAVVLLDGFDGSQNLCGHADHASPRFSAPRLERLVPWD
jgi:hypothetical protein